MINKIHKMNQIDKISTNSNMFLKVTFLNLFILLKIQQYFHIFHSIVLFLKGICIFYPQFCLLDILLLLA